MTLSLSGASSWFGGPNDHTTGSTTASGAPVTEPGIAVNDRATLGGWWAIRAPNGVIAIVRQTDLGPASWTKRAFDYTYSLLPKLGYTQQNFPTGASTSGVYLGQNLTSASTAISGALATLKATPRQALAIVAQGDAGSFARGHMIAVTPSGTVQTTDPQGGKIGSEAVPSNIIPTPSVPGLGGIEGFLSDLTSSRTWLRVAEVIGGVVLIVMGLVQLAHAAGAHLPKPPVVVA